MSLGLETAGGVMSTLIERNSIIPTKKSQIYSTYSDNQNSITIKVFEGEKQKTIDNNQLGEFHLGGIPLMPKGQPKIEITYDLDANGILNVSAIELSTGVNKSISVTNNKGRLSKEDIDKMINKSDKLNNDDKNMLELKNAKNNFEILLYSSKEKFDDEYIKNNINQKELDRILKTLDELNIWFNNNQDASKDEYIKNYDLLFNLVNPYLDD